LTHVHGCLFFRRLLNSTKTEPADDLLTTIEDHCDAMATRADEVKFVSRDDWDHLGRLLGVEDQEQKKRVRMQRGQMPLERSEACSHRSRRRDCRLCNGNSLCVHGRRRSECVHCGGTSLCGHDRRWRECRECNPNIKLCSNACKECGYRLVKERVESNNGCGLCSTCDPNSPTRKKQQEESVKKALLKAGWKELSHCELLPPSGYFKREHTIDFECVTPVVNSTAPRPPRGKRHKKERAKDDPADYCKIDFILGYDGGYVYLEVDERQHRFGYRQADGARVSCDAKRMANVHTSLTLEFACTSTGVPSIYWLRYNPHEWHINGNTTLLPISDREERLCAFLRGHKPEVKMVIGYAFYDYDAKGTLDVLLADEFPEALKEHVLNLEGLELEGMRLFGRDN